MGGVVQYLAAFDEVGLLCDRHPDIGTLSSEAGEVKWSDPNDGRGSFIQMDGSTYHARIGSETTLPESIAEYHNGDSIGDAIALRIHETPVGRQCSQFSEVVGRRKGRACRLHIIIDLHGGNAQHSDRRRERLCVILIEDERWKGHFARVVLR